MPENTNDPVAEVEAQVIYRCASYSPVVPADYARSLARQLRDAHEALDVATNAQEDAERQLRDAREQYGELIMAVGTKWAGETRHQTALRYIRQRESYQGGPDMCAKHDAATLPATNVAPQVGEPARAADRSAEVDSRKVEPATSVKNPAACSAGAAPSDNAEKRKAVSDEKMTREQIWRDLPLSALTKEAASAIDVKAEHYRQIVNARQLTTKRNIEIVAFTSSDGVMVNSMSYSPAELTGALALECLDLHEALHKAAYALFQAKRLVDAGPATRDFVRAAHAEACKVLDGDSGAAEKARGRNCT